MMLDNIMHRNGCVLVLVLPIIPLIQHIFMRTNNEPLAGSMEKTASNALNQHLVGSQSLYNRGEGESERGTQT